MKLACCVAPEATSLTNGLEWEDSDKKPMSPANIRFLCMGKMLQDEDTLERKLLSRMPQGLQADH
jgi:hypothetical protein